MKAGRELDALVAEKVMGISVWKESPIGPLARVPGSFIKGDVPHYSTDIAAAWEVVEKFSLPDPDQDCYPDPLPPVQINAVIRISDGRWMARFDWTADLESYYEVSTYSDSRCFVIADSAPLAICLAALEALEDSRRTT